MKKVIFLAGTFLLAFFLWVILGCKGPQVRGPQEENFFGPPVQESRGGEFPGASIHPGQGGDQGPHGRGPVSRCATEGSPEEY
jgi:hypothetical protein